jgi:hypothetical protein
MHIWGFVQSCKKKVVFKDPQDELLPSIRDGNHLSSGATFHSLFYMTDVMTNRKRMLIIIWQKTLLVVVDKTMGPSHLLMLLLQKCTAAVSKLTLDNPRPKLGRLFINFYPRVRTYNAGLSFALLLFLLLLLLFLLLLLLGTH